MKMKKNSFLKIILALTVLIVFVFLLLKTIVLHRTLNDWEVDFSVSETKEGSIELKASVLMEGNTWRYFRGMPLIEIHGIDFPYFFANGGVAIVENKSPYGIERIYIKEDSVKSSELSYCKKDPRIYGNNIYRIFPSVTEYRIIKNKKFVDIEKSKFINYKQGLNDITIILSPLSGNSNNISAELIFKALSNRTVLIYPLLGTIFMGVLLLLFVASFLQNCFQIIRSSRLLKTC